MSPFLTPMSKQILSLAFDPMRHLLAVGYGNTVALFHQQSPGREYLHTEWKMLELIKGPCNNASGLVNVLLFCPIESGRQILLIGYAEAGWNVWSDIASVKRISPDHNHNVCRIGRAALGSDGRSIAVSTLDHAIVTYTLGREGPILASMKEFPYQDSAKYTPIVPIASTLDGLTLGGTASGQVPMIETGNGVMSLMRHESKTHLVREIATHGQKVVIGSSSDTGSIVKCYSSSPVVTVTDTTAIEAMEGWDHSDGRWKVIRQYGPGIRWRLKIGRTTWNWIFSGMLVTVLMLSANPPGGASFDDAEKESEDTEVLKPQFERHMYWIFFGVRHFCKFAKFQVTVWFRWMASNKFGEL
ncbi:hypothetical protein FRC06_008529 [Ceratobasidium sp. 370]|nr:hypothetical protein FRC06_008529 [Ceratobasidium sp. 370]